VGEENEGRTENGECLEKGVGHGKRGTDGEWGMSGKGGRAWKARDGRRMGNVWKRG